ncbi:MAG: hypothetical protein ACPIOQ_17445 [Promethearchaeia archaeon]
MRRRPFLIDAFLASAYFGSAENRTCLARWLLLWALRGRPSLHVRLVHSRVRDQCRTAALLSRKARLPAPGSKVQQTFALAAGARFASVGPAASAKKVSDDLLKKLGELSTQVCLYPPPVCVFPYCSSSASRVRVSTPSAESIAAAVHRRWSTACGLWVGRLP